MSDQSCKTCNAWKKLNEKHGACRARPPVPVMLGMAQRQALDGLSLRAGPPEPQVLPFFPTMSASDWCREWQPRGEEDER
jgi:hypothetical protein